MSSEAATYFPDALANVPEDRGTAQSTAAIPSDHPDSVRHNASEAPSSTVISITEISDEALLGQVCQGTREALGILFRRHARTVRNVAYRILRDDAEADDLVQDVFIFICRKAALFNGSEGTARSWILQVTYHRAFDRRRHLIARHFYTSQELDDAALNMANRRREALFSEWSMEAVWGKDWVESLRALLSPSQLSTIELHFFEGYTFDEIADHLGQTLTNTYHHYYRGLEKLRKSAVARKLLSK